MINLILVSLLPVVRGGPWKVVTHSTSSLSIAFACKQRWCVYVRSYDNTLFHSKSLQWGTRAHSHARLVSRSFACPAIIQCISFSRTCGLTGFRFGAVRFSDKTLGGASALSTFQFSDGHWICVLLRGTWNPILSMYVNRSFVYTPWITFADFNVISIHVPIDFKWYYNLVPCAFLFFGGSVGRSSIYCAAVGLV